MTLDNSLLTMTRCPISPILFQGISSSPPVNSIVVVVVGDAAHDGATRVPRVPPDRLLRLAEHRLHKHSMVIGYMPTLAEAASRASVLAHKAKPH